MSALRDAMSHAALGWVKPELDETLRQARGEIEYYAENPADSSRMHFCANYLHQVQGTLRMVELYAPAMVAEEMEILAKAVQNGEVTDRNEACATLMRGTVLLPDYLERLQDGHRDIPIVLLPLLNEIRAARGAAGLNEAVLFAFDQHAQEPTEAELDHARGSLSGRNRALLDTVGAAVKEELLRVKDALDLHLRTGDNLAGLQSQVGELGSIADTLGVMGLGVARNVVLDQRDALQGILDSPSSASESLLLDIAGALLYVDASLDDQVARLGAPTDEQGDDSSAMEARRTIEVLASEAITNFAMAREHFVAFIETNWQHDQLTDVPRLLGEVAGALRMLELQLPADYTEGVSRYVATELLSRHRIPSGRQLDTLADAMASLEYYLEALRERRPNRDDILDITRTSLESLHYWPLPAEQRTVKVVGPSVPEPVAIADSPAEVDQDAQDAALLSIAADDEPLPAQEVQHETLTTAESEHLLETGQAAGPEVVEAESAFVEPEVIEQAVAEPEVVKPAFVEPVIAEPESRAVVVERETPESEIAAIAEPEIAGWSPEAVPLPSVAPQVLAAPTTAAEGAFATAVGDIDDDIREVFLEEFDEEIANLHRLLPPWNDALENMERLRPIRRVFHTLKGSGRLVGATVLGEFSWKVESMLNRVLDGTRPASPAIATMVQQVHDVLPQLNAALRGRGVITADLSAMEAVIERLTAGEDTYYIAAEQAPTVATTAAVAADAIPEIEETSEEEGTPASVDSVLREILEAEVAMHLEKVRDWLSRPQPVSEALVRAMHTMNGAFGMTEVPEITLVTQPAESYLKRSLAAESTPSPEGVGIIAEVADAIARTIAALQKPSPRIPVFADLAQRLNAFADSLPEARWPAFVPLDEADDEAREEMADEPAPLVVEVDGHALRDEPLEFLEEAAELAPAETDEREPVPHGSDTIPAPPAEVMFHFDATYRMVSDEELMASAHADHATSEEPAHEVEVSAERSAESSVAIPAQAGDADAGVVAGPDELAPEEAETGVSAESLEMLSLETDELAVPEPGTESVLVADADVPATLPMQGSDVADELALVVETEADGGTPSLAIPRHLGDIAGIAGVPALDDNIQDLELVDIFVEEGSDLLDHCDGLLNVLRAAPDDRSALTGLQRDLHTLKGGARMAGINAIGDLAHTIESLLESAAAGRISLDHDDIQVLERGFDQLHSLVTQVGAHRAVVTPQAQIEELEQRAHRTTATILLSGADDTGDRSEDTAEAVQPEAELQAEPEIVPAPKPQLAPLSTPLAAPISVGSALGDDDAPDSAIASKEQVRVRADLLDRLVNQAGEVAIYRSRLEQQLGAFRGAMSELDRTNARLRDQLRRLDLETEAQIVARYQREHDPADLAFDPLELDRFSTLQQLSRALNESAADLTGLQGLLDDLSRQYDGLLQQQARVSSELQDGLMRARMVPFDGIVPRLRRVVRQAGRDAGKQVRLELDGTHGELDRNVLDHMVAPLEHMLRNSVAHGLEKIEARRAAGKPEEGVITLRMRREGSEVVLQVTDDGAGLNRAAIRSRAEERGLIQADAVLSDAELDRLILESGFTTSGKVSQLAGRGVGMDVVRNEVHQLGGSIEIHSVTGHGSTFTLRLPQTLAVTQAVFVQIGETTFAVPVASVSGIGRIARERFESGAGGYHYSGEEYMLHDLGMLVGQPPARAEGQAQVPLLLVGAGDLRAAVAIDQVLGNREIVVKPVGMQISSLPGIYGATITGDGRVVVILDMAPLVRRHLAQPAQPAQVAAPVEQRRVPLVMVVDDSLTMRKVTGRVLERHNLEVVAARDGIEALERLEEQVPDLMLLDIEMPRMDGYELATAMRADPRFKDIPIVMITSRTGDKHRQRALEIGVQRYMGKPYQELDLMRNVYDLLGIARVRK